MSYRKVGYIEQMWYIIKFRWKEVRQYKVFRKDFTRWKNSFDFLPALRLQWNDMVYAKPSFAIEFHWLVFHARVLWLKEEDNVRNSEH